MAKQVIPQEINEAAKAATLAALDNVQAMAVARLYLARYEADEVNWGGGVASPLARTILDEWTAVLDRITAATTIDPDGGRP